MADLIFRGVKNPANCSECFFWPICPCLADFDDYSAILDAVHDGNLVRHEECPVYPLPEGHGRLIDADEISGSLSESATFNYNKRTSVCWSDAFLSMIDMLDDAPTIVPAEGGTDDGN